MIWITLLLLGSCLSACLGNELSEVSIQVDLSSSHAFPGDNLTVVCRVNNMPEDGYIYWFKTVLSVGPLEHIDLIALSTAPMPPYDKFARYKFDKATSGDVKYYTMNIINVTKEETSHIGCSYRELEENVFESENYEVYKNYNWQTVKLNESEISHEEGMLTEEGENYNIEIVVGDSVPAAHLTIYLGDDDITDQFYVRTLTDIVCSEGGIGKTCALHYTQRARATASIKFTGDDDGKTLLVTSVVPDAGFGVTNKTYPIAVNYSPMFRCMTKWSARLGSDFTISCAVKSNPKPELFTWEFEDGRNDIVINPDQYISQGRYDATVEHVDGACVVTLTIYKVDNKHFHDYYLTVGNSMGNNTLEMSLMEDTSPTAGTSGAAGLVADIFVALTAILSVLHMCHLE